jgi:hypothetical protein
MANNLNKQLQSLALKYYGTKDFSQLQPYQLDKLTSWVTWSEDKGKNQSRKAEMALRQNKKFRGKRHKSKSTFVE